MAKIILAALSFKGCPYSLQKSYQMFCLIRRFHCTYSLQNSYHLLCLTRTVLNHCKNHTSFSVSQGLYLFTAKITPDVLSYTEVPLYLFTAKFIPPALSYKDHLITAKIIPAALSHKDCTYSLQKSQQMLCLKQKLHCTYSIQKKIKPPASSYKDCSYALQKSH